MFSMIKQQKLNLGTYSRLRAGIEVHVAGKIFSLALTEANSDKVALNPSKARRNWSIDCTFPFSAARIFCYQLVSSSTLAGRKLKKKTKKMGDFHFQS